MFSRSAIILFSGIFSVFSASCQDVRIVGRFQLDSLKIGGPVPFSLTARYPSTLTVLFPDTTFSFAPFELQNKKYFPTVTRNNISVDSAVYFLTTYEIDSIQTLHLPAFVIHAGDCTKVDSNTDSIIIKQLVRIKTDSLTVEKLPLKTDTEYFRVSWLLNYPLVAIVLACLLVVLAVLWLVFGRRLRRYYRLRRLTKKHAEFVQKFTSSVHDLLQDFSATKAESIFVLWKRYMESLAAKPYTRYTAQEIMKLEKDETLVAPLRALNRIIYAGIDPKTEEPFTRLQNYTEALFTKKTQELKNG